MKPLSHSSGPSLAGLSEDITMEREEEEDVVNAQKNK